MNKIWIIRGFVVLFLVPFIFWFAVIWYANALARVNFGSEPCWFVQSVPDRSPPRLMPGPRGFYLPNPLRQINRRFVGIGLQDPEVRTPHFAVAALDSRGRPTLWGWSYWSLDFWSLTAADDASGFYDSYTDLTEIVATCRDLPPASPAYSGHGSAR